MKDLRPALRALLLADPTVSQLVGGDRIYAITIPQEQRSPSLVYHRVFDISDYHMQGDSGIQNTLMQINAIATTPSGSDELARAAHDQLSGFHGVVTYGAGPDDFIEFQGIFQAGGGEIYDETRQMYGMRRDYRIFYAES